jgi:hypothetical protein
MISNSVYGVKVITVKNYIYLTHYCHYYEIEKYS